MNTVAMSSVCMGLWNYENYFYVVIYCFPFHWANRITRRTRYHSVLDCQAITRDIRSGRTRNHSFSSRQAISRDGISRRTGYHSFVPAKKSHVTMESPVAQNITRFAPRNSRDVGLSRRMNDHSPFRQPIPRDWR